MALAITFLSHILVDVLIFLGVCAGVVFAVGAIAYWFFFQDARKDEPKWQPEKPSGPAALE